jgi:hypothetical protein
MRAALAGGAVVIAVVLTLVIPTLRRPIWPPHVDLPAATAAAAVAAQVQPGFLYGRVTAVDGPTYEGRLRWGGDQEAFWGDYFNGAKDANPWIVHLPSAQRPAERRRIEIFGFRFGGPDQSGGLDRLFMARFGDIARIDAGFADVRVTLKTGTTIVLDRFEANDVDDGVRVWDHRQGIVDLDTRRIRTIEFLPTAPLAAAPVRLRGTVRTRAGEFSGFIQWDRQDCVGSDELEGRTADGEIAVRYDTIRAIARRSRDSALVTLADGRELLLSGTREAGDGNLGVYVDDARYGRVLVSWDAFERVELSAARSGPAYGDFPPGRPLAGQVTTRDGRRLAGRLVYDLDESETTETLDAPSRGVDYTIPFSLIASIVPRGWAAGGAGRATVILRDGEQLDLERMGDLGQDNAGLLIFAGGRERPEYVPWSQVEQVDLDRGPTTPPPPGGRRIPR